MKTNKSLYFLHIPKTGGLSLQLLQKVLINHGVTHWPNKYHKDNHNFMEFYSYRFICWHLGLTPIKHLGDRLDYATMLREPLDRVVSNFSWLLMAGYLDYIKSYDGLSVPEKLRHYLFEDDYYSDHKNLQTKFLSASISDLDLDTYFRGKYFLAGPGETWDKVEQTKYLEVDYLQTVRNLSYLQRTSSWHLNLSETSLDVAKNTIDNCSILGFTEDHEEFLSKIFQWFRDNLDIEVEEEFNTILQEKLTEQGIPTHNYSRYTDNDGTVYTTQSIKELLTKEEIDQVYADNSLDVELYAYAKNKI